MSPLRYQNALYVQRQAIEKIVLNIKVLADTGILSSPAIYYLFSCAGSGRTFVLESLRASFAKNSHEFPVIPLYYSFDWKKKDLLQDLAERLFEQINQLEINERYKAVLNQKISGANSLDRFALLCRKFFDLAKISRGPTFLFLLDNIDFPNDEAYQEDCQSAWAQIETKLIEPLITRRCMVISTGENKASPWSRYDIRTRLADEQDSFLPLFDLAQTHEQLNKAGYPFDEIQCSEIAKLSAGIPRLSIAIADLFSRLAAAGENIDFQLSNADWREAMDMLYAACEEEFCQDQTVWEDLEILYPLRSVRVETVRHMLTSLNPDLRAYPDLYFRDRLRRLDSRTGIVWYDSRLKAYIIHPAIRDVINRHALIRRDGGYSDLHASAARMYWEWAQDTPKVSEVYLLEVIYHSASQYQAGFDLTRLEAAIAEICAFARHNLSQRRLTDLIGALSRDAEIHELLPPTVWGQAMSALQAAPGEAND